MNIGALTAQIVAQAGWQMAYHHSVRSTNDLAKQREDVPLHDSQLPRAILADAQTHGRGRGTNTWITTDPGAYLLSSWVLTLTRPPHHTTGPQIGLALWECCMATWPQLGWSVKPPNDLYLNGKKIAGLLIENMQIGDAHTLIIGLGFNVHARPSDIATATHLTEHCEWSHEAWRQFIRNWCDTLTQLSSQLSFELSEPNCQRLLVAINRLVPQSPYAAVSAQGDLIRGSQVTEWRSL